jgi:hypothetical protein
MITALMAMLLSAAPSPCAAVPGADQLLGSSINWVVIGEMHGTNETPDAFADLVCLAAKTGRPVTVALEYPVDEQPVIDAFLASDGGPTAQAGLLAAPVWHRDMQDGRTSVAFLRLFHRLRVMKQHHLIEGVRAFDVPDKGNEPRERNAAMADHLTALVSGPDRLVMVLVGNFHAVRHPLERGGTTIRPAAALLPRDRTVTINVIGNGGVAWNCQQDGCGPHDYGGDPKAMAGIVPVTDADGGWDMLYMLGKPVTAAVPAVPAEPRPGNATGGGAFRLP